MTIERAFASASDALDQTSLTQVDSMVISNPPAGEYLCLFSAEIFTHSSATDAQRTSFSVFVGGVEVDYSTRHYEEDSSINNAYLPMFIACEVNPNGSQDVEVKYIAASAASPLLAYRRELLLFPAQDILQDTDDVLDELATASWTTVDSMTRTPPAGDYLLVFSTTIEGTSGDTIGMRASVGGTPIAASRVEQFQESSWAGRDFPMMLCASISPNGSQVVEIEWSRVTGSGTIGCKERTMLLIPTDAANIFQAVGVSDDPDSTTTDKLIDDMTITDPGADDYLVLFAGTDYAGSIGDNLILVTYSIRMGGVQEADSRRQHEHEGSVDYANIPVMLASKVTVDTGTDEIEAYWQNTTTTSRTMRSWRTLIAIREGELSSLEQEGFRFRNDDADEDEASWRQNQDVDDEIAKDTNVRLRTLINATGDPATKQFQLEYKETSDPDAEYRKVPLT